jgi:hypothetical protein
LNSEPPSHGVSLLVMPSKRSCKFDTNPSDVCRKRMMLAIWALPPEPSGGDSI